MTLFPVDSRYLGQFAPFWDKTLADLQAVDPNFIIACDDNELEIWVSGWNGVIQYLYKFSENCISQYKPAVGVSLGGFFMNLLNRCMLPRDVKIIYDGQGYHGGEAIKALTGVVQYPDTINHKWLTLVINILDDHSNRMGPVKVVGPTGSLIDVYFEHPASDYRRIVSQGMEISLELFMQMMFLRIR